MTQLPHCRAVERRAVRADGRPGEPHLDAEDLDAAACVVGTITLDETDRHRRRLAMTSDEGLAFVLSLATATLLRDGDRLVLDDGRRLVVRAAPEPLHEVRANDAHHLLRLAWHMGNRHLPTQLMADHLRIRRDAVIGDMLIGLGAELREVEAGFDPEGGAYGDAPPAPHSHEHPRSHERSHERDDSMQARVPAAGHGHEHGHDGAGESEPAPTGDRSPETDDAPPPSVLPDRVYD